MVSVKRHRSKTPLDKDVKLAKEEDYIAHPNFRNGVPVEDWIAQLLPAI
jgi:hypothetical protein